MENFTEKQIQGMIAGLKDEFGPEIATRELALLELEDMKRKGCVLDFAHRFDECRSCPSALNCPVLTWEKRHPEYANDELAMKIKALENKARDQFRAEMRAKVIGEFKKLKVEVDLTEAAKALEATASDMIEAAREFEEVEGQSDEVQLKALAKVNEALDKIRHSKLGFFLEKTKWFV